MDNDDDDDDDDDRLYYKSNKKTLQIKIIHFESYTQMKTLFQQLETVL